MTYPLKTHPPIRSRKHKEMTVHWISHNSGFTEFKTGLRAQLLVNNGLLFTWPDTKLGWKQQYVETDTFYHSIVFSTDGGSFDKIESKCGSLVHPFVTIS
jgi:hypothetical protein